MCVDECIVEKKHYICELFLVCVRNAFSIKYNVMKSKIKIGITHGDINGIGYELIIRTLADSRFREIFTPVIYGSSKIAGIYKKMIPEASQLSFNIISSAKDALFGKANLINCIEEDAKLDIGVSTVESGNYAVASLNAAIADLKGGVIDAVVTAPFNKSNVQSEKFAFPGHTELFSNSFASGQTMMLMISEDMKIGIVSNHEPIEHLSKTITKELVLSKIKLLNDTLVRDFTNTNPKIAVLSLNPHAGDNGLIGMEEIDVIIPAIEAAKDLGINAFGPFSADAYFAMRKYRTMDATLAMYHDQGMIPFKLLSMGDGVNFTAGLSVVRTSPAHGVAYDIAGKNIAEINSMRNAFYQLIDIYNSRKQYHELLSNPLPYYSKDNWGKDTSASDISTSNAD